MSGIKQVGIEINTTSTGQGAQEAQSAFAAIQATLIGVGETLEKVNAGEVQLEGNLTKVVEKLKEEIELERVKKGVVEATTEAVKKANDEAAKTSVVSKWHFEF